MCKLVECGDCPYCHNTGRPTRGQVMMVNGDLKPGEPIWMVGLNDPIPCPRGCIAKRDWGLGGPKPRYAI